MNFTRRILILLLTVLVSVSALIIPASAAGTVLHGIGFVKSCGIPVLLPRDLKVM